jgi:hypothetical protein
MLAPQLDFATEEFVTFSGPGTRDVRGSGHEAMPWRDNPSVVTRWWAELPSFRNASNSDDDGDGPRCEQNTTGKGR